MEHFGALCGDFSYVCVTAYCCFALIRRAYTLQVIHLDGYTLEEKLHIATEHLLPRQLQRHGLDDGRLEIGSAVIQVPAGA